ncbi:MAG: PD-(D/E)XK nuclease family protein, partial [Planctomycetota bacterium]
MSQVQFILGRSGTGKTRRCVEAVCDALAGGGDEPLILLVPEQATYQAERAILSHSEITGFSRLRILSFNRLQFWLSGGAAGREISNTGKHMVTHKLLLELSGELQLYKGDIQRLGLASKLSGLIDELQQSNCTIEQIKLLVQTLSAKDGHQLAAAKWADIARVLEAYETFFQTNSDGFVNPDAQLRQIARKVVEAPFLQGARIWVDGFSGFSVQERDLLIELLRVSESAAIALCLNPETMDLDNADDSKLDECSLFASTEQTYCELLRIIRGCKLDLQPPVLLTEPKRFQQSATLSALEQSFIDEMFAAPVDDEDIQIAACPNIRAEAMHVAAQIHTLVKDQGLRYRDIAVVVPDMTAYQHYIESAFGQYEFPYFLDRPRQMKTHPLVELIGSALQAIDSRFALSDILSFLKSGMAAVDYDAIDTLENYCRAFEISGGEWLTQTPWDFAPADQKKLYDEKALDALRRQVIKPLVELSQSLSKADAISAAEFVAALWELLETLGVQQTLSQWAEADQSDQQFGHRQLFDKVIQTAEEMCRIFEDTTLAADAWGAIFVDALSTLTIKLIPPTLDQVLVGSIERSRHPDVKAIFLIGATQKQFPIPTSGQLLLSEQDYQHALDMQLELNNPYEQQLTHRQYLAYIALTRASKAVYLSYPMLDEKGSSIVPWSGLES